MSILFLPILLELLADAQSRVPGVPPTGKLLEVPFTSIVNIRGDRLFHEHIAWDQATLLRQLGLLPEVCKLIPTFLPIAQYCTLLTGL